jgi:phage gp36-like protein
MPYAAISDMTARWGVNELIRLSVLDGGDLTAINQARVTLALTTASAQIDTYLRKRYLVPVTEVLPELIEANCILARYTLMFGEQKEPTEQARLQRKEIITWLEGIRDGTIVLDGAIPSGEESYAQVSTRGFTTVLDDGDLTGSNTGVCGGAGIGPVTDQSFWGRP